MSSATTTSGPGTTSVSAVGDPNRPVFEGYSTLAAWAAVTKQVKLGLLVGANTFRNPTVTAKTVATIDHISGGRAIMGLGGAWHVREHAAFGVEFGSGFGERLDWLEEALQIIRPLLHGDEVTHDGPRYRVGPSPAGPASRPGPHPHHGRRWWRAEDAPQRRPARGHVERPVAAGRHPAQADGAAWRTARPRGATPPRSSSPTTARSSSVTERLMPRRSWTPSIERNTIDPATAGESFWAGTVEGIAERLAEFVALGFETFTIEELAPFDHETLERLIGEVKPLLERGLTGRHCRQPGQGRQSCAWHRPRLGPDRSAA